MKKCQATWKNCSISICSHQKNILKIQQCFTLCKKDVPSSSRLAKTCCFGLDPGRLTFPPQVSYFGTDPRPHPLKVLGAVVLGHIRVWLLCSPTCVYTQTNHKEAKQMVKMIQNYNVPLHSGLFRNNYPSWERKNVSHSFDYLKNQALTLKVHLTTALVTKCEHIVSARLRSPVVRMTPDHRGWWIYISAHKTLRCTTQSKSVVSKM